MCCEETSMQGIYGIMIAAANTTAFAAAKPVGPLLANS